MVGGAPLPEAITVAPTGMGCPCGITWIVPFGSDTVTDPGSGCVLPWQPMSTTPQSVAQTTTRRAEKSIHYLASR